MKKGWILEIANVMFLAITIVGGFVLQNANLQLIGIAFILGGIYLRLRDANDELEEEEEE